MKKRLLAIILIFACTTSVLSACGKNNNINNISEISVYRAEDELTSYKMQDDLKFIKEKIEEVHPEPYNFIDEEKFNWEWEKIIENCATTKNYEQFYFEALKGLRLVNDSNTKIKFRRENLYIPLEFIWKENGAWITRESDYLKRGDRIIKIGNKDISEILDEYMMLFPTDNKDGARVVAAEELSSKYLLDKLGLVDENDRVKIEVLGINNDNKISYLNFANIDNNYDIENVNYDIYEENSLGVLRLNNCINDDEYKTKVYNFFMECLEKDIGKIALDLRLNSGGDIEVINEFLKYTNVTKYKTYEIKYKSSEDAKQRNMKNSIFTKKNIKVDNSEGDLYDGQIYVLTSNRTRNEAVEIASIFKVNEIAQIIGERTGSAPNHYTKSIEFITPKLGIQFFVSTAEAVSPDDDYEDDNALKPDIYINYTGNDIVSGEDSVVGFLKAINN